MPEKKSNPIETLRAHKLHVAKKLLSDFKDFPITRFNSDIQEMMLTFDTETYVSDFEVLESALEHYVAHLQNEKCPMYIPVCFHGERCKKK